MTIYAMLDVVKKLEKARLVIANFRPFGYGLFIPAFLRLDHGPLLCTDI